MNDTLKNYSKKSKIDEAMHVLNTAENGGIDPYCWESRSLPTCPHCGHELTRSEAASIMRKLPSEVRSQTSRNNGKKGGAKMKCGDCGNCPACTAKAKRILKKQKSPS